MHGNVPLATGSRSETVEKSRSLRTADNRRGSARRGRRHGRQSGGSGRSTSVVGYVGRRRGTARGAAVVSTAQQQVEERATEVSRGRYEDEEVAGEVRQRQAVDDVLHSTVVEVARPRRVGEHLSNGNYSK